MCYYDNERTGKRLSDTNEYKSEVYETYEYAEKKQVPKVFLISLDKGANQSAVNYMYHRSRSYTTLFNSSKCKKQYEKFDKELFV